MHANTDGCVFHMRLTDLKIGHYGCWSLAECGSDGGRMGAKKAKKRGVPADKLALFDKLIAAHPEIERKGANNAYAAVNGNMFLLMQPTGTLAMRLPEGVREEFLKKYKTKLYEAYGAVMKEYVTVPDALLGKTKELQKYLELSYEYAKGLKPKPSKKKS
jgi:TfoX/Sxy family transcriptional regulator of competence genes